MGYTTEFNGWVKVEPPLSEKEVQYLKKFNKTRRMRRTNGPYYVGGSGFMGQGKDYDVIDYNNPPTGQPGLWCQWVPTDDGTAIKWDGREKFYDPVEWMEYLINHFIGSTPIAPLETNELHFFRSHVLNGEIEAQGEDSDDRWKLVVKNNVVTVQSGRFIYDGIQTPARVVIEGLVEKPSVEDSGQAMIAEVITDDKDNEFFVRLHSWSEAQPRQHTVMCSLINKRVRITIEEI
jgi:hypothetical protein